MPELQDPLEEIQRAVSLHQAGQLAEARMIYEALLRAHPDFPDALHLLGMIEQHDGHHEKAAALIEKALALNPDEPIYLNNLAIVYLNLDQVQKASALTRQIIQLQPDNVDAYNTLSNCQKMLGQYDAARASLFKAIELKPDYALAYYGLGVMAQEQNRLDEAERYYLLTLQHNPHHAEACNNLGAIRTTQGKFKEATQYYEQAIQADPANPHAYTNIGWILQELRRYDEAMAYHHKAIAVQPTFYKAHNNLACALTSQGRFAEALDTLQVAQRLAPQDPDVALSLGSLFFKTGQLDLALNYFDQVIALKPDSVDGHWNRANVWLHQGDYEKGWPEYEWRLRKKEYPSRVLTFPRWDGSLLQPGQTLFVYDEQGFGDTVQFLRFLSLIPKAPGSRVIYECHGPLFSLLKDNAAADVVLPRNDQQRDDLPPFDVQLPLMSLPGLFNITVANLPRQIPYLDVPEALNEQWQHYFKGETRLKIGLIWQGRISRHSDNLRSMTFTQVVPLMAVPNTVFYSLQFEQSPENPPDNFVDLSPHLTDFAQTAAIMRHLDLIISIDTVTAHLAGALGLPTWVLLPYAPDWRWMLNREDNAWYPTMRLFRQPRPNDWESMLRLVKTALSDLSARFL